MAAQVDLVRSKVEEELLGVTLKRLYKERKRQKRDGLPSADESERRENDAKKPKLHHNQPAAEHRSLQPHQLQPQDPKAANFRPGKAVLVSQKHSRQQQHPNRRNPPPPLRPPEPQPLQRQKTRTLPPEAPALFSFTPLKGVEIRKQDFQGKPRDKPPNLGVKKENTAANAKHAEVSKKKGGFWSNSY